MYMNAGGLAHSSIPEDCLTVFDEDWNVLLICEST